VEIAKDSRKGITKTHRTQKLRPRINQNQEGNNLTHTTKKKTIEKTQRNKPIGTNIVQIDEKKRESFVITKLQKQKRNLPEPVEHRVYNIR
jgi:hypothetical protein